MDIPVSTIGNALKIGVQVITNHKRPVVEIYYHVRNLAGPESEFLLPGATEQSPRHATKTRPHSIFVQFTAANIGGARATDLEFTIEGEFPKISSKQEFGGIFENEVPQMAPGQVLFLFRLEDRHLFKVPDGGGKVSSAIEEPMYISIAYDGPIGLGNFVSWAHVRKRLGKKMYTERSKFVSTTIMGDLPPIEYIG